MKAYAVSLLTTSVRLTDKYVSDSHSGIGAVAKKAMKQKAALLLQMCIRDRYHSKPALPAADYHCPAVHALPPGVFKNSSTFSRICLVFL